MLELDDLVAAADHLLLDPHELDPLDIRPYATFDELRNALDSQHGRGSTLARQALALARQGAESRPETLLRLLLARAGLPEPELQVKLYAGNRFLGRVDILYPEFKVVVEYDGDGHRANARQYDRDIGRIDGITRAGYLVERVRKRGLFVTPGNTVASVTAALIERGWVPRALKPR